MDDIRNKKIVVVGVSGRPDKFGHKIFSGLISAGLKTVKNSIDKYTHV